MTEQQQHDEGRESQDDGGSLGGAAFKPGDGTDFRSEILAKLDRDRGGDRFAELHWRGNFGEYLDMVRQTPEITRNAYQRLRDMILSYGHEEYESGGQKLVHYKFFDDPLNGGKNAVYGLDRELMNLMRKIDAAARGYGIEKRILLLKGPVGSAKSTIAELFKRGLEDYSKHDQGKLYSFGWIRSVEGEPFDPEKHQSIDPKDPNVEVKWSPMNEDPLNLIPAEDISSVLDQLNDGRGKGEYKVQKPVGLSAPSRREFVELMERYNGDLRKVLDHVVVKRVAISEADRTGIGTFQPKDQKDQDASELTGELNFREIAVYGDDSDPRAFNFNGELCVANRGLFEGIEILKVGTEFLYEFLTAAQERRIKPKKFAQTSIDTVLLGHTNEPEYQRLVGNRRMEALVDRLVRVPVPYNIRVGDEQRIYEKDFTEETVGKHVAPHTLEIAAMIAVISRLAQPANQDMTVMQKMKLYDGQAVDGYTGAMVKELQKEAALASDGFREAFDGLSPRYIQNAISESLTDAADEEGINPFKVMHVLKASLAEHPYFGEEEQRKRLEGLIEQVKEEYYDIIKNEVQMAIAGDEKALQRLCSLYIENVKAYTRREKVVNPHTGAEENPDERLMRSIESKINVDESTNDDFRREIMNSIGALALEGQSFEFDSNPRLLKALQRKLFEDTRDTGRLPLGTGAHIDEETQDKIDTVKRRLKEQFGYNEHSATQVMNLVSSIMARGESSSS